MRSWKRSLKAEAGEVGGEQQRYRVKPVVHFAADPSTHDPITYVLCGKVDRPHASSMPRFV